MTIIYIITIVGIMINLFIDIHIDFLKNNDDNKIIIKLIALFGLIKVKKEYPLIDVEFEENLVIKVNEETEGNLKEDKINKKIGLNEIANKVLSSMDIIKKYKTLGDYIVKRISCKDLFWETEIGFDDAATTGLIVGLINIFKTNIYVYIRNHKLNFNKISLNTIPNFNSKVIKTTLTCIFRIKIVHIIIAGLKLIRIRFTK